MLRLDDIHFSYDEISVLKGVSLEINHGEIVGIMGANGTGKSTLLKLMSGALTPGRGRISFLNEQLSSLSPNQRAKRIAMVPQESVVPFSFTALEIVLMGRAPYLPPFGFESRGDVRQAHDAMERTDCIELADRDINTLSGGEKQRVMLARALAQCPELLLLDEPTSFLDIRHTAEFIGVLKKLNRSGGITIVCAIHDLNLAASFCQRIVLIKNGGVIANGSVDEIIDRDIIRKAFDIDVHVGLDEGSGKPYCFPR
jgi:cobalamin transport system ATP-binding protein